MMEQKYGQTIIVQQLQSIISIKWCYIQHIEIPVGLQLLKTKVFWLIQERQPFLKTYMFVSYVTGRLMKNHNLVGLFLMTVTVIMMKVYNIL